VTTEAGHVPDGDYSLDPAQSVFSFAATAFLVLPVKGTLRARSGIARVADGKIAAEGSAEAGSVATGIKARNWHLRHKHYLHAAEHPEVRLVVPAVPLEAETVDATLYARGSSVQVSLVRESLTVSPDGILHARLTGSFDRAPLRMLHRLGGVSRRIRLTFDVVARRQT
jgi:polyisoprenoid-binding protein YceI